MGWFSSDDDDDEGERDRISLYGPDASEELRRKKAAGQTRSIWSSDDGGSCDCGSTARRCARDARESGRKCCASCGHEGERGWF